MRCHRDEQLDILLLPSVSQWCDGSFRDGTGEVQDRGLSQIPSTPKRAFDCHTDTQPTNHKSIPLDSKTWVPLDGQLLWG